MTHPGPGTPDPGMPSPSQPPVPPQAGSAPTEPGAPTGHPPVPPQGGAPWPWAVQQPMRTVETEPLEYHRLLRGVPKYRWWKPLVIAGLAAFFFLILNLTVGFVLGAIVFAAVPMDEAMTLIESIAVPDTQNPVTILVGLLSVVLTMIPAVWFAYWIVGVKPASRVLSVALKLRWGLIGRTMGLSVLAIILMNALGVAIGMFLPLDDVEIEPAQIDVQAALLSMLIVLLLVPIQAAAEEILFRGAFMQVIGSWLRSPWLAILIPSVAFALAHAPTYGIWGMTSVGMMGVTAAYLTWRTGGLEAAISLHVVNNLVAFTLMATGLTGSTDQNDDSMNPLGLIGQALGFVFYVWITLRVFKKQGYGWQRIDLLQVPDASVQAPSHAQPIEPPPEARP